MYYIPIPAPICGFSCCLSDAGGPRASLFLAASNFDLSHGCTFIVGIVDSKFMPPLLVFTPSGQQKKVTKLANGQRQICYKLQGGEAVLDIRRRFGTSPQG